MSHTAIVTLPTNTLHRVKVEPGFGKLLYEGINRHRPGMNSDVEIQGIRVASVVEIHNRGWNTILGISREECQTLGTTTGWDLNTRDGMIKTLQTLASDLGMDLVPKAETGPRNLFIR